MKEFMNYDFDISTVCIACFVQSGAAEKTLHCNRANHGIVFNVSGDKKYVFSNGKTLYVYKGDVFYLPEKSNYSVESLTEGACYAINFQLCSDIVFDEFALKTKQGASFQRLFHEAYRLWENKTDGYMLKTKSLLYDIFYLMHTEYNSDYTTGAAASKIQPALSYIHDNYTKEAIFIDEIAKLCGISDTYFRRIFKSVCGVTPIKYINTLKLDRAAELISTGMYSIKDVAFLSGFFDDSYFDREFKKRFSVSPSKYGRK